MAASLRVPKQTRSRQTLERILLATERLLESRSFEEISVADIAREARASVGSFYARFSNKQALLPQLYERYDQGIARQVETQLASEAWSSLDLQGRVDRLVRFFVRWFAENRGLLRAIGIHARLNPEALPDELIVRRKDLHRRVAGFLLARESEITHPEPADAVELGIFAVGAFCREKILFGGAPHARSISDDLGVLERELVRILFCYLRPNNDLDEARL